MGINMDRPSDVPDTWDRWGAEYAAIWAAAGITREYVMAHMTPSGYLPDWFQERLLNMRDWTAESYLPRRQGQAVPDPAAIGTLRSVHSRTQYARGAADIRARAPARRRPAAHGGIPRPGPLRYPRCRRARGEPLLISVLDWCEL